MRDVRSISRALTSSALFLWVLFWFTPLYAQDETVVVQTALDGDSLLLADSRQVRMIGINAPEFGKNGEPNQPLAQAARDRTKALVRGRTVQLTYDQEHNDRYGRVLAYVTLPEGLDLQDLLVREGLAWFVAIAPNTAHYSRYRAAEDEAHKAKLGIWSIATYEPISAERAVEDHRTGFQRVSGVVDAVRSRKDFLEISLARHVQLIIPRNALASFTPPPDTYVGKRVIVRGWFTEHQNGLRTRITHPAMLEIS